MLGLTLPLLISRIIILVISLPFHELAHAFTADRLGDDTPRMYGRLSLNPLVHLDVMGSLMILVAGFGWAKPVPINPYALQRRTSAGVMWVSLAGPMSNLLLALLATVPLKMGIVPITPGTRFFPSPYTFLLDFIAINLLLMVFNLIPLAPLDGEKIFSYFFPPPVQRFMDQIRPYGPVILMGLVFVLPFFGLDVFRWILLPVLRTLMGLLGVG